jgi:predicted kinase
LPAPEQPLLVIVTGPPGSGKTTIAEALRERTRLPLIAKDTLKEILGERLGVTGAVASKQLGSAVLALMGHLVRELLRHGVPLIVEGNRLIRVDTSTSPDLDALLAALASGA